MWRMSLLIGGLLTGASTMAGACDVVVANPVVHAAAPLTLSVPAVAVAAVPVAAVPVAQAQVAVAQPVCVAQAACAVAPVAQVHAAAVVVAQGACDVRRLRVFGGRARSRSVVRSRTVVR